jgi:small nuclear ribonucleoprotein D3
MSATAAAAGGGVAAGKRAVGVPVQLFREAESHVVTVELRTGDVYRGKLEESEDTMNCQLRDVVFTARDGRVTRLDSVYLRGSQVRFVVLPELLKGAPLFQKVRVFAEAKAKAIPSGSGRGRGKGGARGGRGRGRGALPTSSSLVRARRGDRRNARD